MKNLIVLFLFLFLVAKIDAQKSEKRLALVIGNSAYTGAGTLKNPVNDANLMAKTLQELDFTVIKRTNATRTEMAAAVAEFWSKLGQFNVALFYFAGHGVQVNGVNYLIPVDAKIENKDMVAFEAISVNDVSAKFEEYGENINILILDACRNNPFRSWARGGDRGFRAMNPASGTLIAFATSEGSTAADGKGENGLFTEQLVKQLKQPVPIEKVFKLTRVEVEKESDGQQSPQEWSKLKGDFYFTNPQKEESVVENLNPTWSGTQSLGSLQFNTEILGSFYLDGQLLGDLSENSENKLENIKAGNHIIEIRGVENWKKEITIIANQTIYVKAEKTNKTVPVITMQTTKKENATNTKKESSLNQFNDSRDNKTYKTVQIGNQIWMAENLNISMEDSWCYDNNEENGKIYGRLYTFDAAKKACPVGWHLPSDEEWMKMESELGISQAELDKTNFRGNLGIKIKSKEYWYSLSNGSNEAGFNVLPAGFRDYVGKDSFSQLGKQTFFWSNTEKGASNAWRRGFHYSNNGISRIGFNKEYAYSVRCVKD